MFVFFNDTPTTEIYTLSLHDALPICPRHPTEQQPGPTLRTLEGMRRRLYGHPPGHLAHGRKERQSTVRRLDRLVRSEEHTSELQSRQYFVCRLLLAKKIS